MNSTYLRTRHPNPSPEQQKLRFCYDFVIKYPISEIGTVFRKCHKSHRVLKTKDFYVSIRCIPITHSRYFRKTIKML